MLRESGIPVTTGVTMRTLWAFQAMLSAGGVTLPEQDVTTCGGG